MVSKSAKQNCSTCLHGHEPHVNRMSKKSNPMLSVMAGNKSSFIGGARKRARNLALFFLSFTFLVASVIGIAVHAEFAFGPCGRLSLLSRTEPCEWPCTLKIGNLLCQVASGATLQKVANLYSTRPCLPGRSFEETRLLVRMDKQGMNLYFSLPLTRAPL